MSYRPLSNQSLTCLVPCINGINIQLLCGVRVDLVYEVEMFFLFSVLVRVGTSLEIMDLKGGITINASCGLESKLLNDRKPTFLPLERHQTNSQ